MSLPSVSSLFIRSAQNWAAPEELPSQPSLKAEIDMAPQAFQPCGGVNPYIELRDRLRQRGVFWAHASQGVSTPFIDPHSFAKPHEVVVTHMDIDMKFDLSNERLYGDATLTFTNFTNAKWLHLDSKGLTITSVEDESGNQLEWFLGQKDALLGQELLISIPSDKKSSTVKIKYITSQDAEGLYWNTQDPDNFLLYSHSQPTYTRSWLPCQDTPQVRMTYDVTITTDSRWQAAMSSCNNPQEKSETGIYQMKMGIPIPSYLMAFCVGNFEFKKTGERTGIYAHPDIIKRAFAEFHDLESVLEQAEELLGEYRWGRYDMLILPVDFPAGATENPMISFFSSMIIAGDRSLLYYLFHELAHSWSGNNTTAKGWEHLWLNEGMTTYFELLLAEEIKGKDYAEMIAKTYYNELLEEIEGGGDTALRMRLEGKNPRDSFTSIPYYKGYFFLKMLEEHFGREVFTSFLKKYFNEFKFQSITTEEFESYMFLRLFKEDKTLMEALQVKNWLYNPLLPSNCPIVQSEMIEKVDLICTDWLQNDDIEALQEMSRVFTAQQWIYFIQNLKKRPQAKLAELDKVFNFSKHPNATIRDEWLITAIESQYEGCYRDVEAYVLEFCKPKIVKKFMSKLVTTSVGLEVALKIYEKGKSRFFARSRAVAEAIMQPFLSSAAKKTS